MYTRRIRLDKSGYGSLRTDGRATQASKQPPGAVAGAVALGYDASHDPAPRVLASGKGKLAEHIIAVAQAHGIAIREDPVLVAALAELDIGALIPPELYAVVAEVLAYVYRIHKAHAGKPSPCPLPGVGEGERGRPPEHLSSD